MTEPAFEFLDPGPLVDGDLALRLEATTPWNLRTGWVPAYLFTMHLDGDGEPAGRIGLRVGDTADLRTYAGHIGYTVEPHARGRRLASRACRLLLPLARRHGLRELWITCNPDNVASRRTCEILGASFADIVDLPEDSDMYRRGERQKCRYRVAL